MDLGGGARYSSCGECDVDRLGSDSFHSKCLNQLWIAPGSVCNLIEAIAGSLSVASIADSSAKVTVVDCCEVDRSVVYNRCSNGTRTLPWGTAALICFFTGCLMTL
jgi:hypothetical protein